MAKKMTFKGEVARAKLSGVRVPPRKARLIVEMIKGRQVDMALQLLANNPRKGARVVEKLLRSAIANASEQKSADVDSLWVIGGWADMGKTMKRFLPRAQGRATPIRKQSSCITVLVGEKG